MNNDQNIVSYRDGTGHEKRKLKALNPAYVSLNERSVEDILHFIEQYAKKIKFYDESGGGIQNWSNFVKKEDINDILTYIEYPQIFKNNEKKHLKLNQPHLVLFLSYLQLLQKYIKPQLNTFTKRHLDFYYKKALGLSQRQPIPDQVNILVELGNKTEQYALPAGTLLTAGKDSLGNNLLYQTDSDLIVNQAQIDNLKKIYIDKEVIGLKEARYKNKDNTQKDSGLGFIDMFRIALGLPLPGDPVPPFIFEGVEKKIDIELFKGSDQITGLYGELQFISTHLYMATSNFRRMMQIKDEIGKIEDIPENENLIHSKWAIINHILKEAAKLKNGGEPIEDFLNPANFDDNLQTALAPSFDTIENVNDIDGFYSKLQSVERHFFMPAEDFIYLMGIHDKYNETSLNEWEKVYSILTKANERMVINERKNDLKTRREEKADDPDKGFLFMMAYALGSWNPDNKSYELPDLPAGMNNLDEVYYTGLNSNDENKRNESLNFVEDELFLTEEDFGKIIALKENPVPGWDKIYAVVEVAQRKKQNFLILPPAKTLWKNIYAASDATKVTPEDFLKKEESHTRWKTLGGVRNKTEDAELKPATIGFAVSSPILNLKEGKRTITLTINFKAESFDKNKLATLINLSNDESNDINSFRFLLSNKDEWVEAKNVHIEMGTYAVKTSYENLQASMNGEKTQVTLTQGSFGLKDVGGFIVWDDAKVYKIETIDGPKASVIESGKLEQHQGIRKYAASDIYFNALRFQIQLGKNTPSIEKTDLPHEGRNIESAWPVLKVLMNDILNENQEYVKNYPFFKELIADRVSIHTLVQDIEEVTLQNNNETLNPKSPFNPFGDAPPVDSPFYFTHPELSTKILDSLTLHIEWTDLPENLKTYYNDYWAVMGLTNPITDNLSFKGRLLLRDGRDMVQVTGESDISIFQKIDGKYEITVENIPDLLNSKNHVYDIKANSTTDEKAINWNRYFSLELSVLDFLHNKYDEVLLTNATNKSNDSDYQLKVINKPYTPKAKNIKISYTSSLNIQLNGSKNDKFIHIHPFGYEVIEEKEFCFLPQYDHEGELYIGLKNMVPPRQLSMLFQMAEGSGNPDLENPGISWACLDNNQWRSLDESIMSDTTKDLATSGIILFDIPNMERRKQTLLPDHLHWLRNTISHNSDVIPDTVSIETQAVSATLLDQDNAHDHFENPLPPESITRLAKKIPQIKKIKQPFSSDKGKGPEKDEAFYIRISERLRHKNRPLSMWDYERMILEKFPEIYKIKCIPSQSYGDNNKLGRINIIVVPDIKGKIPFNPFEPKVPIGRLTEIEQYINKFTPRYAKVAVQNATYVPIKSKFNVKFKNGYETGYYRKQLEEDIKKYLAPWAYDHSADITIGGEMHANILLNFIEERPYVDFISKIKLFIGLRSSHFKSDFTFKPPQNVGKGGENVVYTPSPDAVLTSSKHHEIGFISDSEAFKEEELIGIGYMHVELDFIVAEDE